jgi:hypothetical protein
VRKIWVPRRGVDQAVEAELHDDLSVEDLLLAERSWTVERANIMAELRRRSVPRDGWPESLHWNWLKKAGDLRLLGTTQFGIFCEDRWQALLMSKTVPYTARLAPDEGKPLVYVDFVEVAPWNWNVAPIDQHQEFKALGSTLLKAAVQQSLKEGFYGRVGLHALPKADMFYRGIGMTTLGADAKKQNLNYFEFSGENAQHFVNKWSSP